MRRLIKVAWQQSCPQLLLLHTCPHPHPHTRTPAYTLPNTLPASVSIPTGMACHKFGTQLALVADNFILFKYANEIIEPE